MTTIQAVGTEAPYPIQDVRFEKEHNHLQQRKSVATKQLRKEELAAVVEELNKAMQVVGTTLAFTIDEHTKKTVVKVLNAQTGEVIRQIPPEEMLKVSQRIAELMGILIDQSL
ncbi:MAG: flagellar protein FlaG [Bacteroidetes bacterium]|nr:flagellar protein FlaG [Bacteroidota bacterium]